MSVWDNYKNGNAIKVKYKASSTGSNKLFATSTLSGVSKVYIDEIEQASVSQNYQMDSGEHWIIIVFATSVVPSGLFKALRTQIAEIIMGNGITEISSTSFCDIDALTAITFSNSLKKIGNNGCLNRGTVSEITLPSTLISVDVGGLANMPITTMYCWAVTEPSWASSSVFFSWPSSGTLHIPVGSTYRNFKSYKSGWTILADLVSHKIEPDRDNLEFSSTGGTDSISVESSSNWTATTESDWITFAQSEFEAGTVQFAVSVSSNSSGRLRSGSISLENAEGDIATVEIEQRQNHILFNRGGLWINKMMRNGEIIYKRLYKAPFLELSKTKVNLKTTGGTDTVSVSTDGNWTATTEASFLTLSKDGNNLVIEGTATGETTASITVRTEIAGAIKTKEIAVEVSDSSVVVDLMSNWSYNTVRPSQQGYTIFMSDRYKGVASSWCRMKVTFSGFETFTFKYGSCAESNYDYVLIGNMDNEEAETSTATNTGSTYPWKSRSYGQQSSAAPNLTETFENDGGEHFFWVAYRKDGSADVNDDRGYIGILTEQISEVKNPYSNVIDA